MNPPPFYLNEKKGLLRPSPTLEMLKNSSSYEFHSSLPDYKSTPMVQLDALAQELGVGTIYLKDESHRFGLNAFKALGASYAIHKMLEKDLDISTFCTATDGNHGRAVAWSARLFGKKARIFVPKETTAARIRAIQSEGAIVEQLPLNYDETCKHAAQKSKEQRWQLVQDTAWKGYEEVPALIKAGYLTHFFELEDTIHSWPQAEVDLVFLQAGVGSWPAAAAWYYHNRYDVAGPKIILVEPKESSGILESFRQGERSEPRGRLDSIMAGLNCGIPSLSAWEILQATVDAAMEVEDEFAEEAIRKLYFPHHEDPRVISGESGAGGLAGLLALMTDPRFAFLKKALKVSSDTNILVYNTEGNTDPENFEKIISK